MFRTYSRMIAIAKKQIARELDFDKLKVDFFDTFYIDFNKPQNLGVFVSFLTEEDLKNSVDDGRRALIEKTFQDILIGLGYPPKSFVKTYYPNEKLLRGVQANTHLSEEQKQTMIELLLWRKVTFEYSYREKFKDGYSQWYI